VKWQNPEDYHFARRLSADEWAWEFLRRNPVYQEEWHRFIAIWRALEADYGKPAQRDVAAWQRDPRAWVPAETCQESDCRIEGERVLIECALGARWGFYKFPPDPADDAAVQAGRLVWREASVETLLLNDGELPPAANGRIAIGFDLALPLAPQLEQAKRRCQIEQRRLIGEGRLLAPRISAHAERLIVLLRLLDGQSVGAALETMAQVLAESPAVCAERLQAALELRDGNYRRLLHLH
jgi:hypothetical protein